MYKLLNRPAFYFLAPLYVALALLLAFFNVPDACLFSLTRFVFLVTIFLFALSICAPLSMKLEESYLIITQRKHYRTVALGLSLCIFLCAPLDIYFNGFKLLNPDTYTDLPGIGRYIRHITILCWTLIPIAFIFIRLLPVRLFFIVYALVFPIIIIDRNRLLLSCYTLLSCLMLQGAIRSTNRINWRGMICNLILILSFLTIFALLGKFRSGNHFIVPSLGHVLQNGTFPLSTFFGHLPTALQQIILYAATPLFNFSFIDALGFSNDQFLLSQFSPFSRGQFSLPPFAPILVPRYNVGTEFYPFLLFGGFWLAIAAFILMLFSFIFSAYLLKKSPNIFTFLIFLRISYCVLFMGFAPQFFIFLNLMFVLLMLFLWLLGEWLKQMPRPLHLYRKHWYGKQYG